MSGRRKETTPPALKPGELQTAPAVGSPAWERIYTCPGCSERFQPGELHRCKAPRTCLLCGVDVSEVRPEDHRCGVDRSLPDRDPVKEAIAVLKASAWKAPAGHASTCTATIPPRLRGDSAKHLGGASEACSCAKSSMARLVRSLNGGSAKPAKGAGRKPHPVTRPAPRAERASESTVDPVPVAPAEVAPVRAPVQRPAGRGRWSKVGRNSSFDGRELETVGTVQHSATAEIRVRVMELNGATAVDARQYIEGARFVGYTGKGLWLAPAEAREVAAFLMAAADAADARTVDAGRAKVAA